MSEYYKTKRTYGIFDPKSSQPYKLSRSKLDLFLNCPLCFYLDRRLGLSQPPGFPFALNSAVDALLKKEFDIHRAQGTPHPIMVSGGVDAVPFKDERMDFWRDALRGGIQFLHKPSNFLVTGGVDDVWVNKKGELIIVDYKSTAKAGEVGLDADWQIGYKRQMEIYQWLFLQNGFKVSLTGYFVYCNGRLDRPGFDSKLEFSIKLIPYKGNPAWVDEALINAKRCLASDIRPKAPASCDFCAYRQAAALLEEKPKAVLPAAVKISRKKNKPAPQGQRLF